MREKKEREKVLFLRAHGFVARGILVLECALEKEMRTWVEREKKKYNEPAENGQSTGLAVVCICDGRKEMRTLAPVCCREVSGTIQKTRKKDTRELCEGGGGENKRRSGEGGEIARDGGDAVCVCDVSR